MNAIKLKKALKMTIVLSAILLLGISQFLFFSYDGFTTINDQESIKLPDIGVKASAYEPGRSNSSTGASIDIVAHQSYYNDSFNTHLENLTDSGDFVVPCPEEPSFESSYINMSIDSIYAPDKTLEVQSINSTSQPFGFTYYTSFVVPSSSYLTGINVSIDAQTGTRFYFDVYNAKYETGNIIFDQSLTSGSGVGDVYDNSDQVLWLKLDGFSELLNASSTETYNNTFFIQISSNNANAEWYGNTNQGKTISYRGSTLLNFDFSLIVDLSPISNTPMPTQVGLKVNNEPVDDIDYGTGNWEPDLALSNSSGFLYFTTTADWWNVSCTITQVQINYTKTDLTVNSAFTIPESGSDIYWNVSVNAPGIWGFDTDTEDWNYVNFTIPDQWSLDSVYNGGSLKATSTFDLAGDTQIITVMNADNGTFWYLNATSENLLQQGSGILLNGSSTQDSFNFTNDITFIANFSKSIQSPNNVSLIVYSPSMDENYTDSSAASDSQVSCGTWDVSSTAEEYGIFTIQAFWNNATDCGFVEKNITILGMTELFLLGPDELYYFDNSDSFNVTFLLNDSSGPESPYNGPINADSAQYTNMTGGVGSPDTMLSNGTGYYYLEIDPKECPYGDNDFDFEFNKANYNNQTYSFTFHIVNVTSVVSSNSTSFSTINYNSSIYYFFYNDTISNKGIENAEFSNDTGGESFFIENTSIGNGYYKLNITVNEVEARLNPYMINITVSKEGLQPQTITLSFTISLIDIECYFKSNVSDNYYRYTNLDYSARFFVNRTDTGENVTNLDSDDIQVTYNGANLWPGSVNLASIGEEYELNLSITPLIITSGEYSIIVNISKTGIYEWKLLNLNFTLVGNYSSVYNFTLKVGSTTLTLKNYAYSAILGETLTYSLRIYDDNLSDYITPGPSLQIEVTYSSGSLSATIGSLLDVVRGTINTDELPKDGNYTITITITLDNYEPLIYTFSIVMSNPPPGFIDPLLLLILILALLGTFGGIMTFVVYKKAIIPKRTAKQRVLTEVESVFDDAVNLEHVLVLYKNTGMCVFFKSFGLEEIDPELISGFLSAVSSFGKEMESTQALNEIRYGDKQILLSDGEYIRVALVLGKKPSMVTRKHLSEFINAFEKYYQKSLPDWRGNLKVFQGADRLIDSMLNTSIILPHEIKFSLKIAKSLKKPNSKEVLRIAQDLIKDSERQYFFIGQILTLAVEKLGKEKAEVFIGIKELRDSGLLTPIEITAIEAQPISQQEIDLINQKVSEFAGLSDEERQKLVNDIAAIRNPVEREAYIASLADHREIISKPISIKGDIGDIKDVKSAKKAIADIRKKALSMKKKKEHKEAIEALNGAAEIANTWELTKLFEDIKDDIRLNDILYNKGKLKNFEEQAKRAIKTVKYKEAADFYGLAAKTASKIFKLGDTSMNEEVKRLTNKAKEYEKLAK